MTPVEFMALFEEFRAPSWDGWRAILARLTPEIRELFAIAGRGSGKSRIVALLACAFASREYARAPGESIFVGIFAPDRKQAGITFRYIVGLLRSVPALAALIVAETRDNVELANGIIVEVITSSTAAPRGRAYALAIVEEAAFLPGDEHAADPDVELLRALRPALARVSGSLLAVIGSPYARRGILYQASQDGDAEDRIVIASDTLSLNPTFRQREIERAFRDDPIAARSEYGQDGAIEFRADVSSLLTDTAIAAVVPADVRELVPQPTREACGHFDAATGSGEDSAAVAIAFVGQPAELAAVRQWRPPFSPAAVVREAAALCSQYGVQMITIDRFAPGLVSELFRERGVTCRVAEGDTSAHFVELLALINSQRVTLLDEVVLLGELRRLERRPGTGRDVVGHPPRGHDDVAAAAAAALMAAVRAEAYAPQGLLFCGDDDGDEDIADIVRRIARLKAELRGGGTATRGTGYVSRRTSSGSPTSPTSRPGRARCFSLWVRIQASQRSCHSLGRALCAGHLRPWRGTPDV